jgi:hypothetical protein
LSFENICTMFQVTNPKHYYCDSCVRYHSKSVAYGDFKALPVHLHDFTKPMEFESAMSAVKQAHDIQGLFLPPSLSSPNGHNLSIYKDTPWEHRVDTIVSGGRLLVLVMSSLKILASLQQNCEITGVPSCIHFQSSSQLLRECQSAVKVLPPPYEKTDAKIRYSSPIMRCPSCPSEYSILLGTYPDAQAARCGARHAIVHLRYIDLGECLSPHNKEWACLTSPRPAHILADRPFDLGGLDSIARRFNAATAGTNIAYHISSGPVVPLLDS